MKLEEIKEAIKADFKIDKTDLGNEALRPSDLFSKYILLWTEESIKLKSLQKERGRLAVKKRAYYTGNGTPEEYAERPFPQKLRTETAIQEHINSDPDIIAFEEKLDLQDLKIKLIEAALDQIKKMGFSIKASIDYYKFVSGG